MATDTERIEHLQRQIQLLSKELQRLEDLIYAKTSPQSDEGVHDGPVSKTGR